MEARVLTLQERTALFFDHPSTPAAKLYRGFVVVLIVLSVAMLLRDLLAPELLSAHEPALVAVEIGILAVFTLEYVLRLWSAPRPSRFVVDLYNIVDLLAILPFFLAAIDTSFLRSVRLARWGSRMLRGMKLTRTDDEGLSLMRVGHENVLKNMAVVAGVALMRPSLVGMVTAEDIGNVPHLLTASSMFALAAMFGFFGMAYAAVDPARRTDRAFMHLTSGLLLLPIGVSFVILQTALEVLLTGSTALLTLIIWQVYAAVVLWDFWNIRQLEDRLTA